MSKRSTHGREFKAKVAIEAKSGRKTIQENAADHGERMIQVSQWRSQASEPTPNGPRGQAESVNQ